MAALKINVASRAKMLAIADGLGQITYPKVQHIKSIPSSALFETSREIVIEHDGELYYLRLTRQNRLILTK